MGLSLSLGGGRTTERGSINRNTQENKSTVGTQSERQRQAATQTEQSSATSAVESEINLLDPEVKKELTAYLMRSLGEGQTELQDGLDVNAIMTEARRQSDVSQGQTFQQLAGGAGSSYNTAVQQAQESAALNSEVALAAQEAQLNQAEQEFQLTAQAQQTAEIAQITELLRGATQTTTQQSTQQENSIAEILAMLTNQTETSEETRLSSTVQERSRGRTSGFSGGIGYTQ